MDDPAKPSTSETNCSNEPIFIKLEICPDNDNVPSSPNASIEEQVNYQSINELDTYDNFAQSIVKKIKSINSFTARDRLINAIQNLVGDFCFKNANEIDIATNAAFESNNCQKTVYVPMTSGVLLTKLDKLQPVKEAASTKQVLQPVISATSQPDRVPQITIEPQPGYKLLLTHQNIKEQTPAKRRRSSVSSDDMLAADNYIEVPVEETVPIEFDKKIEKNTDDSHEDQKRKVQINYLSDDKKKDEEKKRKRRERNKRHRENKKNRPPIPVNLEKREAEKHKNREKTRRYREKKKNSGIATVSNTSDSFRQRNAEKCKRYRDKKRMSQFQTKNMYNSQKELNDVQNTRPEKKPNADRQKEIRQRPTQELAEIKLKDLPKKRRKSGSNEDQENIMLPKAKENVENLQPQEHQNLSQWLHICEQKHECISPDVILHRFTGIPGDGNCLFHSLISVRQLSISADYLRNQLRNSPDLPLCHDPRGVYDILSSTNAYGDSDCVFLFSRMYNQNICVHYDFRARRRLDDGTYTFYDDTIFCIYKANDSNNWIHLHLFGQHYTPYFEVQDLFEQNGDIRRKEVNVDANNVCDNDTDGTEDNQGNHENYIVEAKPLVDMLEIKQENIQFDQPSSTLPTSTTSDQPVKDSALGITIIDDPIPIKLEMADDEEEEEGGEKRKEGRYYKNI